MTRRATPLELCAGDVIRTDWDATLRVRAVTPLHTGSYSVAGEHPISERTGALVLDHEEEVTVEFSPDVELNDPPCRDCSNTGIRYTASREEQNRTGSPAIWLCVCPARNLICTNPHTRELFRTDPEYKRLVARQAEQQASS